MAIEYRTAFSDGHARIELAGELDMYSVQNLKAALLSFLKDHAATLSEVHVDLAGVRSLDSTGIALLANLQKNAKQRDARLYLHRPARKIRRLFDMALLDTMFQIVD